MFIGGAACLNLRLGCLFTRSLLVWALLFVWRISILKFVLSLKEEKRTHIVSKLQASNSFP